jgi:DNA-dependent protein kinase catalytic subunit
MAFPRALACLRQSNAARQALRSLAPTVPSRMFLAWTCQMVSLVNQGDNPETEAVVPILAQLARDFPAAVYYPVNLSQSEFDAAAQRKISPVMHTLQKVAAGLQQFVRAVELLANPWDRAISWIKLAKRAYHTSDETKYKQAMQSLLDDCFDAHAQNLGDVNLRFAQCKHVASNTAGQKAAINLNVACKRLHKLASGAVTGQIPVMQAEITSMSKTFNAAMKDYVEHEQRSHSKDWTTPKVTDFTTFFSSVRDHKVELPGSWEHQSQPHEVTTSPRLLLQGVQHRMKRFSTLHSPKVVTFYGSDLKEYAMLAKAGEDLRLDQRLQQMYGVMNQQLREDVDARRRQLRIRTFGVTPTSQQAGLVQMVRCTKDYADVIAAGHAAVRGSKLPRCSVFDKVVYDKGLLKRPPETAAALFNKAVAQTPKHLLREYLLRVATSAEAFLAMRSNFLKTLATFSIAGYITGVGDRHTHNFLVDTSDGSVVGIDFGQSFAVPLQLKVPELSPFRLSPQMRDCLAPLDGIAQFTHTMVHTLRVLRANADVLNSILDVFLNEPLLDWAEQAYNTHKKEIVSAESLDHHRQRFAEQSLDACRAKLAGKNPVTVILQQLSRSPHSETGIHGAHEGTWQQHIATAEGGATRRRQRDDVRGVDQLDVYKQVEVLIDMATDPAVVGRMWRGGAYWL